jgi:four helix bundle protein
MNIASPADVGVRRFQDLVCWQLSSELKREIYALLDRTGAKYDFKFRDQIKDSAASAPSNIAEGFGAYRHRESSRYARIAKSSLTESQNHLLDGIDRGYWTTTEVEPLMLVARRAVGATVKWIAYLTRTEAPDAYWED